VKNSGVGGSREIGVLLRHRRERREKFWGKRRGEADRGEKNSYLFFKGGCSSEREQ